jgi:RNase H-like domain found in reverse transcriptase/Reverse transcriptase (RNA-dependent DNA polymerase)/Integrase zinc binding domain/Integrase core domain/Ty3 transposon capsid-like protein/Chromo (CHRromatin Organisation MOdifier) domain
MRRRTSGLTSDSSYPTRSTNQELLPPLPPPTRKVTPIIRKKPLLPTQQQPLHEQPQQLVQVPIFVAPQPQPQLQLLPQVAIPVPMADPSSKILDNLPNFTGQTDKLSVTDFFQTADRVFVIFPLEGNDDAVSTKKVNLVSIKMREQALTFFNTLDPVPNYADLKTIFLDRFSKMDQHSLRFAMEKLKQKEAIETFNNNFLALRAKGKLDEESAVHYYISALRLEHSRTELFVKNPATVAEAMKLAILYEKAKEAATPTTSFQHTPTTTTSSSKAKQQWCPFHKTSSHGASECKRLKAQTSTATATRPASTNPPTNSSTTTKFCTHCKKKNHDASTCFVLHPELKRTSSRVAMDNTAGKTSRFVVNVMVPTISQTPLRALLDSGSDFNILDVSLTASLKEFVQPIASCNITTCGGTTSVKQRTKPLQLSLGNLSSSVEFHIVDLKGEIDIILSHAWMSKNQIMLNYSNMSVTTVLTTELSSVKDTMNLSCMGFQDGSDEPEADYVPQQDLEDLGLQVTEIQIPEGLESIFAEFKDVFYTDPAQLSNHADLPSHKIYMKPDQVPIYTPQYRLAKAEIDAIQVQVKEMLDTNIIRPCTNPCWNSPLLPVKKPDGSYRVCLDVRRINELTTIEEFPIPRIEEVISRLTGSCIFSCFDLKAGYSQIPLHPDSQDITAFTTPLGRFCFTRVPFGINSAPAYFNKLMAATLGDLNNTTFYFDDHLVFSKNKDEHKEDLKKYFQRIREKKLLINPVKSKVGVSHLTFLGYNITENGISPSEEKVSAIKNFQQPAETHGLRRFLGMAEFYRKFIPNFSEIARPLYALLKKKVPYNFDKPQQEAFETIKSRLCSSDVLIYPNFDKPFTLFCDASTTAIAAILSQEVDGANRPISFASRLLTSHELNYTVSELEMLSVVNFITHFRYYLLGRSFTVVTDHKALLALRNFKNPTGRLSRWALTLSEYNFKIQYRPGVQHADVDALTRSTMMAMTNSANTIAQISTDSELIVPETVEKFEVDPYEFPGLTYFAVHNTYRPGSTRAQINKIKSLARRFTYDVASQQFYCNGLLVPYKTDRPNIVRAAHALGHFGVSSTMSRVKEKYYIPGLQTLALRIVEHCQDCLTSKDHDVVNAPAKATPITNVFDRIAIDLMFGLPLSSEGYKGLLTIMDYCSKYPFAVPIKSKEAPEIAKALFKYFAIFGVPQEILSDNGKEFCNNILKNLLATCGISKIVISPYLPRSNGMVERFHATLVSSLRTFSQSNPDRWPDYLDAVLMSYRLRVHSSTKFTPYEMIFARKPNPFKDFQFEEPSGYSIEEESKNISARMEQAKNFQEKILPIALDNIAKQQKRQTQLQDERSKVSSEVLPVDTTVYYRIGKLKPKLAQRFTGPYQIARMTPQGNYILKNDKGETLGRSVPRNKLKVENFYEVAKIIADRVVKGKREYLLRFEDYDESHDAWVQESQFKDPNCINDYWNEKAKPAIAVQDSDV